MMDFGNNIGTYLGGIQDKLEKHGTYDEPLGIFWEHVNYRDVSRTFKNYCTKFGWMHIHLHVQYVFPSTTHMNISAKKDMMYGSTLIYNVGEFTCIPSGKPT